MPNPSAAVALKQKGNQRFKAGDFTGQPEAKRNLLIRLSSRVANALPLSVLAQTDSWDALKAYENDIEGLRNCTTQISSESAAPEELRRPWSDWTILNTTCPRIIDLNFNWGTTERKDPLPLERLPVHKLSQISFLFGGVGDACRPALRMMAGLYESSQHSDDALENVEIKATLLYTFCSMVMPSYCYDRSLIRTLKELAWSLSSLPPTLPSWLHVDAGTVPGVLRTLRFWLTARRSARKKLAHHESIDRGDFEAATQSLNNDSPYMRGLTLPAARAFVYTHMDKLVYMMMQMTTTGHVPMHEQDWYPIAKIYLTPAELRARHARFNKTWTAIVAGKELTHATERKIVTQIYKDWQANITLFDVSYNNPKYYPGGDGYESYRCDAFEPPTDVAEFNDRANANKSLIKHDAGTLAWDTFKTFFEDRSAALHGLGDHVNVEMICGGLSEKLAKMNFKGGLTRPAHFPRKYTRMWLSNVPRVRYLSTRVDGRHLQSFLFTTRVYTSGPMNMAFFVVPDLQNDPQFEAAASCNCLLNTGSWKNDEQYFYTSHTAAARQRRLANNLVSFSGLLMHLHRIGFPAHWLYDFLARVLGGSMMSDIAPYAGIWPIPLDDLHPRVPLHRVRTDQWLVDFETIIATAYHAVPFPLACDLPADFSRDRDDIQEWGARPVTRLLFYRPAAVVLKTALAGIREVSEGGANPVPGTFFILTVQELVQFETRIRFRLSTRRIARMREEKWSMAAYRQDTGILTTQPVSAVDWVLVDELDGSRRVPTSLIQDALAQGASTRLASSRDPNSRMSDHRSSIIRDVDRSIHAINDIILLLQRDQPLSTDLMDMNYSEGTVNKFLEHSKTVVSYLQSASNLTASWLHDTGNSLSNNLSNDREAESAISSLSSRLAEAEQRSRSMAECIEQLVDEISVGEQNLSSAQRTLSQERDELDRQETMRGVMRAGAIATLFFAPIVAAFLTVVDFTAMENAIDQTTETISRIEEQLASAHSQLETQRARLSRERDLCSALESNIAQYRGEQRRLRNETGDLQSQRASLSQLSVRINDSLRAVNGALSSSVTIQTMHSMRNVVSGIRGVASSLGRDAMFAGPLARLNDSELDVLDRRVEMIRRHRLMV
ncbi:hypothetical protein BD413DRAFT_492417 [Trametes elegans]|nr:hypothetical protein BD413DRAFT_492417 [Trametes elegans]